MSGTQKAMQVELEERGCFVVATNGESPLGESWPEFENSSGTVIPGPIVVLGPATERDYEEQSKRHKLIGKLPPDYTYFYFMGAE